MICENQVKKYCREDISLIENYDKAINDNTQTWDCHHRKESQYSVDELVDIGEYYGVPASDLIFITHSDHSKLHNKLKDYHNGNSNPMFGKHHSEEAKKKMSLRHKGRDTWMKGKHHSAETRQKLSEAHKGKPSCMKGKHHSAETRTKMSESHKGNHWYNNGVICVRSKTCPDGFVPGRILCNKRS